jgi:hypothetical protein
MSTEPEDFDFEDPEEAEDVAKDAGDVADPPALGHVDKRLQP